MKNFQIFPVLLLGVFSMVLPVSGHANEKTAASSAHKAMRIVVQLNSPNSKLVSMGLRNVSNILKAAGDDHVKPSIRVVVFGPALKDFKKSTMKPELSKLFGVVSGKPDVEFLACHNTMQALHLKVQDLAAGFHVVPSGAYEVIRLQQEGFQYFRP